MPQFARGLQLVALLLLPLGMILQIADRMSVGHMLMLMVAGFCLFWIGRIMEGYLEGRR